MICSYCRTELDPVDPRVWQLVIGWERKATSASRKGGSDIACRRNRDKFACDTCVSRLQRGISPAQEALL